MPEDRLISVSLADPEVEPSDEQLEQLMDWVAESVRQKQALRPAAISPDEISALAEQLVERLLSGES